MRQFSATPFLNSASVHLWIVVVSLAFAGCKREEVSSYVSINSYPGFLTGSEFSDVDNNHAAFSVGFTAPVGLYWQWGKDRCNTYGVFFPIIDLAAPVRLRFDSEDKTETMSDYTFKDAFAPGLYFSLGINKTPLTINVGGQYGPKLRNVKDESSDFNAFRIGVGIVFDIPLFTLFSKSAD